MVRVSRQEFAASRAQWLAELACALDQARQLTRELAAADGRFDAVDLCARIEAVRLEVQAMRVRRSTNADRDFSPEWTDNFPWKRSA